MVVLASLYMLFWPDPAGGGARLPGADKVVHVVLFALLAATARWRFGAGRWLLGVVVGYAVASEVVQANLLPGRSGDVYDVLADVAGAVVGWHLAGRGAAEQRSGRLPGRAGFSRR